MTTKIKTLGAYLVSAVLVDYDKTKSCIVIAYDQQEAETLFMRFLKATKQYNYCAGFVCNKVRKSKKNAHWLTEDYYNKQIKHIEKLEGELLK